MLSMFLQFIYTNLAKVPGLNDFSVKDSEVGFSQAQVATPRGQTGSRRRKSSRRSNWKSYFDKAKSTGKGRDSWQRQAARHSSRPLNGNFPIKGSVTTSTRMDLRAVPSKRSRRTWTRRAASLLKWCVSLLKRISGWDTTPKRSPRRSKRSRRPA